MKVRRARCSPPSTSARASRPPPNARWPTRCWPSIPFAETLLYARVDLIQDADGHPVVLELELTEPSLFFAHATGSAERFADAIGRLKP